LLAWATNRTIVELKLQLGSVVDVDISTTNRTIVELKQGEGCGHVTPVHYQSYHSGIETDLWALKSLELISTNRTIVELKQS